MKYLQLKWTDGLGSALKYPQVTKRKGKVRARACLWADPIVAEDDDRSREGPYPTTPALDVFGVCHSTESEKLPLKQLELCSWYVL